MPVRAEPYWRNEGEGQHIGYYRGARVGKWVARYRLPSQMASLTFWKVCRLLPALREL